MWNKDTKEHMVSLRVNQAENRHNQGIAYEVRRIHILGMGGGVEGGFWEFYYFLGIQRCVHFVKTHQALHLFVNSKYISIKFMPPQRVKKTCKLNSRISC